MKSFITIGILLFNLLFSIGCSSQKAISGFSSQTIQPADFDTAAYEKEILKYLNELRSNPSAFYKKYVEIYIHQNSGSFTSYYTGSLKKELLHSSPLPTFKVSKELNTFTSKQLHYLVHDLKGKTLTHNQGNLTFSQRAQNLQANCLAENLYQASYNNPLNVVLDLLIDQGISSLGHRKNILNPIYNLINIQSAVAPNHYIITVINFSCK